MCRRYPKNTAVGGDAISMKDIEALPDEALKDMDELFASMACLVAWPVQMLSSFLALLPKKQGGTRTIAILFSLARLFLANAVTPLREWDKEAAIEGDTAAPGVKAELEVMRRAARAEVVVAKGGVWTQLMWDIQAFYDSMRVPDTLARMEAEAAPRLPVAMALAMHKAPRFLRLGQSYAEPITTTGCSVLAGCPSSTSLARGYMLPISRSTGAVEGVTTNQHVDDLSHGISADSRLPTNEGELKSSHPPRDWHRRSPERCEEKDCRSGT